jgi:beta-ureidopropionase
VQILCLQEIFNGPYFCPSQDARWYDAAEPVPGPTTELMRPREEVRDGDRGPHLRARWRASTTTPPRSSTPTARYLGKYRKQHIPQVGGFWEKFYFKPGNLGYPVFETRYAKVGVVHLLRPALPRGRAVLGLNGAEIVFNPSATVQGLSQYLWKIEQPAHAVANGYFVGAINRVGTEAPWNIGKFYGTSYFVNPRGNFRRQGSRGQRRARGGRPRPERDRGGAPTWQFYRDRRPETYEDLTKLVPCEVDP